MSKENHIIDQLSDFVTGWIAGCAGVVVSHPFDTIKTRLQSQGVAPNSPLRYNGTIHCLVETIKKEKVAGLFKGITPPLIGNALCNSIVFGVYGNVMRILSKDDKKTGNTGGFSFRKITIASVAVGFAQSLIVCPMELIKAKLQIQTNSVNRLYTSPIDCIRKIYRSDGFKGLFRGFGPTIIRDIPGFFTYFHSFELICLLISGNESTSVGPFGLMFAGGMAGTISWASVFPTDVIKTRIQIDTERRYSGFIQCLKSSFKEEQWKILVRGLTPALLRAFPMNAAMFTVNVLLKRIYSNHVISDELNS